MTSITPTIQSASLQFREGNSDKEYHAAIEPEGEGYTVSFSYGRRSNTLTTGTKTPYPTSLHEATKVFDKLVSSKLAKGYQYSSASAGEVIARSCYRHHTGGHEPSSGFIEDAVANTVANFFERGQYGYDKSNGRLRTYLRFLINARVVDLLRKERPIDLRPLDDATQASLPAESPRESNAFARSLLASLVEDLRSSIPFRQFQIFERVKLKHQSPDYVAEDLGVQRAVIDRNIYKAMTALSGCLSFARSRYLVTLAIRAGEG